MTMRRKDWSMKASDVMRESQFLFGEKMSFEQAFPMIEAVRVECRELGRYGSGDRVRVLEYRGSRIGEFIECSNPLCFGGGFSIASILRGMVRDRVERRDFSVSCQGHEGSRQGRRLYGPCGHRFEGTVTIRYQQTEQSGRTADERHPGGP